MIPEARGISSRTIAVLIGTLTYFFCSLVNSRVSLSFSYSDSGIRRLEPSSPSNGRVTIAKHPVFGGDFIDVSEDFN